MGANATGGEARARCTRGGGQGELWGSLQGRETVCGGGQAAAPRGGATAPSGFGDSSSPETPASKVRVSFCPFFPACIF